MLFSSLSDMSAERGAYFDTQLQVAAVLTYEDDKGDEGYSFSAAVAIVSVRSSRKPIRCSVATSSQIGSRPWTGMTPNRTAVGHSFSRIARTHSRPRSGARREEDACRGSVAGRRNVGARRASDGLTISLVSAIPFGAVTLTRSATSAGRNPYIVAYVDRELIRDHNDIDDPRVIQFINS